MIKKLGSSYVKELFLLIGLSSSYQVILNRHADFDNIKSLIAFVVLYFGFVAVVLITSYIKNNLVRLLYACFYFISFTFLEVYFRVTGKFLSYPDFISMVNASGFIVEALVEYVVPLSTSCLFGIMIFTTSFLL